MRKNRPFDCEEVFNQFVNITNIRCGEPYRKYEKEDYRVIVWRVWEGLAIKDVREFAKKNKWTATPDEWWELVKMNNPTEGFFSVMWDYKKQKVSINEFVHGYGVNRLRKIYPIHRRTPILCVSDQVYAFTKVGRKYSPRVYTGNLFHSVPNVYICNLLNCSFEVSQLFIPWKGMSGFKMPIIATKVYFGIDGPWILRQFHDASASTLNDIITWSDGNIKGVTELDKWLDEENPGFEKINLDKITILNSLR